MQLRLCERIGSRVRANLSNNREYRCTSGKLLEQKLNFIERWAV